MYLAKPSDAGRPEMTAAAIGFSARRLIDDCDELRVVHPDPHGVAYPELAELRVRFASHLAGRYRVWAGHPDGPSAREAHPTLHFVRARSSR